MRTDLLAILCDACSLRSRKAPELYTDVSAEVKVMV